MLRETWTVSGGGSPRETWRARGWKWHSAAVNGAADRRRAVVNGAGRAVVQARGRLVRRAARGRSGGPGGGVGGG
eukprot:scaffold91089_cov24-Phaeocystis_antarctica.AAC.1